MNNTKSIFNSAKNTLKSYLNKSNSNNNLLTDNTFTNNSIYNTLNSNYSRDKKESPGNPYLMEKITSLLNKNKPHNNYNFNSLTNNQPSSAKHISNRDFIKNQYNNVNIQNFNFTNNVTQKNLNTIDIIDSPEKIISGKIGKNLLDIVHEKFSKSNNNHGNSEKKENCKNNDIFNDSIDTDNKIKINKIHEESKSIYEENLIKLDNSKEPNKKINTGNYFSPPSSKKRLVEKFYNLTENKINNKNHLYHNLLEKKSKNEIVIRDSLRISMNSNNQKDLIVNFKNTKGHKFDFSRYNYKSQDLTALLTNRNIQEGKFHRNTIISNDSKETNSKSHSRDKSENFIVKNNKNNINNFNFLNNNNISNENNKNDQIQLLDKKSHINTIFDDKKSGFNINKNFDHLNTMEIINNNILTNSPIKIDNNYKKTKKDNQIYKNNINIDKSQSKINIIRDFQTTDIIGNEKSKIENLNHNNLEKFGKKNHEDEKKMKEKNALIIRDVKSLHIITQKALTTKNNIISLGDTIEEERKKTVFNMDSSDKALFIDDNSDMPVGVAKSQDPFSNEKNKSNNMIANFENVVCKTDSNFKSPQSNSFTYTNALNNNYNISEKERKQIINIININNNYNIGNLNFTSADNIYSITNPNSNFKENNSKSKYNAFLMSKENSKTKKISNSNSNYNKTKNRIDPKKLNKNVSIITNTSNPSLSTKNNINLNNKISVEKSLNSLKSSSNISSLNNQNTANLFNKQQLSNMYCDNSNFINNIYLNSNLNTPTMNSKNNMGNNKYNQLNKENNLQMNSIVEFMNNSKEKNIPQSNKNANNYCFLENTSIDSNKLLSKSEKIKEILKSCKKDENNNRFIKISPLNKNK